VDHQTDAAQQDRASGPEEGIKAAVLRFVESAAVEPTPEGRRVRQILAARRSGICTCNDLPACVSSKAGKIGKKIVALQALQVGLLGMRDSCTASGSRSPHSAPARLAAAGR
jgi:hypothetical protein